MGGWGGVEGEDHGENPSIGRWSEPPLPARHWPYLLLMTEDGHHNNGDQKKREREGGLQNFTSGTAPNG